MKKYFKSSMKKAIAFAMAFALTAGSFSPLGSLAVHAEEVTENVENTEESRNTLTLWYDEPASEGVNILSAGASYSDGDGSNRWQQQTLPIGNGDMGANVYGEIVSEHLTFNEKTLWTGGPSESRPNYMGGNNANKGQNGTKIKEIQQAFLAGNVSQAEQWCASYLVGDSAGYGAYQAWGDIWFDYKGLTDGDSLTAADVENYERTLDLTTAVSKVSFTKNGTDYTREFFISHDDNVLVGRLEAEGAATLNFDVRFTSKQGGTSVVQDNNTLKLCGQVADNQLKYASYITVVPEDGTVTGAGDKLTVTGATAVTVYLTGATDYANVFYNEKTGEDYYYRTGETAEELQTRVKADVDAAVEKGYAEVKEDHLSDYQELFNRVELNLGQIVSDKTTDQLLASYKNGSAAEAEKRQLEIMLFQYGRYLTISSSREDSQLPSNLQGVWNYLNSPPWSSDYHMNVNLQMNYWPTYSTNLAECALPLIDYIDSLREPGRVTAEVYFGVASGEGEANGFNAHTQCTPFGWTCPGWSFDWGWSPAAVPWIIQNCWEYYEFTGDVEFMRTNIYPMLKEEALFYDATLIRDDEGKLVSAPSYSPETGPRTAGNTYEQSLTWQLYEDAITAAKVLGVDADLVERWEANQADLKGPIEIGNDGQIKEWYNETYFNKDENGNNMGEGFSHRHISHMLGLFPGDLIAQNEEWLEAARVSMNLRTDSSTGWGMGQRINTWARLGDGNRAHKLIGDLFKGGIYPNLWDSHSPFQIDGNFGMTSGVSEMLLQSNMGYINMLPAIPDAWADGSVEGLVARGNFEIDMQWADGSLTEATILSKNGGTATVQADNVSMALLVDSKGTLVDTEVLTQDRISFETIEGETYTFTGFPGGAASLDAPKDVEALRLSDKEVLLYWSAVERENVTYTVLRQIGDGEAVVIAENITTCEYTDTTVVAGFGDITYQVKAVCVNEEEILSSALSEKAISKKPLSLIDDRDASVVYGGSWKQYGEPGLINNTSTYIDSQDGHKISASFYGNGIEIYTCVNHDRGMADVYIDGEFHGKADSYRRDKQNAALIYTVSGLQEGRHTVELRLVGEKNESSSSNKFEFDAFKALGVEENISVEPTGITVSALGGITTVVTGNSNIQMVAEVTPEGSSQEVTWSVSDETLATIDATTGLLTVKEKNGSVTVTATSAEKAQVIGSANIIIAIWGQEQEAYTEIVEDTNASGVKNENIVWTGSWSPYNGNEGHHGGYKTESSTKGNTISYTFTGTGIEVYAPITTSTSGAKVTLDGESKENIITYNTADTKQVNVASYMGLENTTHTIVLTVLGRDEDTQCASAERDNFGLDYFVVHKQTVVNKADKTELQQLITTYSAYDANAYTETTFAVLTTALQQASVVLNDMEATEEQVTSVIDGIKNAAAQLERVQVVPVALNLKATPLDGTRVGLSWEGTNKTYVIYQGTKKVAEVTTNSYIVNGLTPATTYTFSVQVKNSFETKEKVEVTTLAASVNFDEVPAAPTNLRRVAEDNYKIAWDASETKIVKYYKVSLNGQQIGVVAKDKAMEYDLTEVITAGTGANYVVSVEAVSEYGVSSKAVTMTISKVARLAMPTANKATDSIIANGTEIQLSAEEGATIYYTIDGSYPTVKSSVYTAPIVITERTTVKAIAVKDGYRNSEVAVFLYKIQGTQYTIIFNSNGGSEVAKATVNEGELAKKPIPSRPGYNFKGWFLGRDEFDFKTPIIENLTLIAKWEKVNKTELQLLVSANVNRVNEGYSDVEWKAFENALSKAQEVLLNEVASQETVDVTLNALTAAAAALDALDGIRIEGIDTVYYDGEKHTFNVKVYDGPVLLEEGTDYTVSYKNNTNAYLYGEEDTANFNKSKAPKVTVKMKGNYSASRDVYFKILPMELQGNVFVDDLSGSKEQPKPVVLWKGKALKEGKNKDYTVTYNGKDENTGKYSLTIKGEKNFGGTMTVEYTVKEPNYISMSQVKVATIKTQNWVDGGVELDFGKIKVTYNGKALSADEFEVTEYIDNEAVGTAYVVLTGLEETEQGDYAFTGTKTISFKIAGTSISKVKVNNLLSKYTYTGEEIKALELPGKDDKDVEVTCQLKDENGVKFTYSLFEGEDSDYTVSYQKHINKGTATMILTGNPARGFTGTKKVNFKIVPQSLADHEVEYAEDVPYMKGGAKPEVVLYNELTGEALKEGIDYTVSYKNNKNVADGVATLQVKGKGNYNGKTDWFTFNIIPKDLSEDNGITVVAKDKAIKKGQETKWKQSFKVYDADEKALAANRDYVKEAEYMVIEEAGVPLETPRLLKDGDSVAVNSLIQITVKGMKNYDEGTQTSEVTGTYRVVASGHDISKASFKIANKFYTGNYITLDADDFTKATLKITKKPEDILLDKHFVIVDYENNVNKGTAKVILRGNPDFGFGGEKVVTFKISQRDVNKNWWENLIKDAQ